MKKEYKLIDSHKLLYHPDWVKKWFEAQGNWEKARTIYPLYVEVSPAGQCNHRCAWCGVDYIGYKNRLLDLNDLSAVFRQMIARRRAGEDWNGVKSIMFAGEGEPTLHPKLADMIIEAKNTDIDVALTTNGTSMSKDFIDRALANLSWIKVSLDAATPEVHAINHHASREQFARAAVDVEFAKQLGSELKKRFQKEFNRIINNIQYACQVNRTLLNSRVMIGGQLLLNPTNVDEVCDFVSLMKKIGCDYCVIKPYSQHFYSINRQEYIFGNFSYRRWLDLGEKLKAFEDDNFTVVFRVVTMEDYESSEREYAICQATPMAWGYIMSTGEFVSCSAYLPRDIGVGDQRFVLGNIKFQTFQEIWEGEARRRNWEFVNRELDIKQCRKNCRMNAVNKFLWKYVRNAFAMRIQKNWIPCFR